MVPVAIVQVLPIWQPMPFTVVLGALPVSPAHGAAVAVIVPEPVTSRVAPLPTTIAAVVFVPLVRLPNALEPPLTACQVAVVPDVATGANPTEGVPVTVTPPIAVALLVPLPATVRLEPLPSTIDAEVLVDPVSAENAVDEVLLAVIE